MIVFVVTSDHAYTHKNVLAIADGFRAQVMTYAAFFGATKLPRATYVFTDLDRLSWRRLWRAAAIYRQLRDQGVRVLNDPARVKSRYGLLRQLYLFGINRFNAYRVEEGARPVRWPVFLRAEGNHVGPLGDLLPNWEQLRRAISAAEGEGVPIACMVIIEFAAEPVRPRLYRRLASFRVGSAAFANICAHEDSWIVKYGKLGIAPPELYDEELTIVRDNPYAKTIDRAFEVGGLDYGRADFGLVDGTPQIYEINSNPSVGFPEGHPHPARIESYRLFKANYLEAMRRIDSPDDSGEVEINLPPII